MLVSKGYPVAYQKGSIITGLPKNKMIFYAGTSIEKVLQTSEEELWPSPQLGKF